MPYKFYVTDAVFSKHLVARKRKFALILIHTHKKNPDIRG